MLVRLLFLVHSLSNVLARLFAAERAPARAPVARRTTVRRRPLRLRTFEG